MQKYHHDDIAPIQRENERDEKYKGKNAQIDSTRTKDNIHILRRKGSYLAYINKRINELGCRTKKDTVLMSSGVIGASPEFFDKLSREEIEAYFKDCYDFFAERYGHENIISAVVHLDETTPHMHLNLIPVLNGRLCCKHLFGPPQLRALQTDIYEKVGKKWGLKRGEQGSKTKHLDTAKYKAKRIVEDAEQRAEEIDLKSMEQMRVQSETEKQIVELKAESRQKETEVINLTEHKMQLEQEVEKLTEVKSAADEPVPVFGKGATITALRVENAQLKQKLAEKDKAVQIAQKDQTDMFKELQRVQQAQDIESRYKATIEAMRRADPTAFNALLEKARSPQLSAKASSNKNSK